jgi:hypothetical protein
MGGASNTVAAWELAVRPTNEFDAVWSMDEVSNRFRAPGGFTLLVLGKTYFEEKTAAAALILAVAC